MKTYTWTLFLALFAGLFFSNPMTAQDEVEYDKQQVSLVQRGVKFIAAYQDAYKTKYGELPKLNFKGAVLAGVDFRGMNLDNADFRDSDLRGARFGDKPAVRNVVRDNEGRVVKGNESVPSASLKKADFRGADIGEFDLAVADFSLADCTEANFSDVDLTGAKFIKTILVKAKMKEASLIGTNFRQADLTDADISGCDVEGATFDHTILIRTQMAGLNVDESVMHEVILTEKALAAYLEKEKKGENIFKID